MKNFSRIDRLPPYTLGIVNELKHKARQRGEQRLKMVTTDILCPEEYINYDWL
jgi:hypothetical protein